MAVDNSIKTFKTKAKKLFMKCCQHSLCWMEINMLKLQLGLKSPQKKKKNNNMTGLCWKEKEERRGNKGTFDHWMFKSVVADSTLVLDPCGLDVSLICS